MGKIQHKRKIRFESTRKKNPDHNNVFFRLEQNNKGSWTRTKVMDINFPFPSEPKKMDIMGKKYVVEIKFNPHTSSRWGMKKDQPYRVNLGELLELPGSKKNFHDKKDFFKTVEVATESYAHSTAGESMRNLWHKESRLSA